MAKKSRPPKSQAKSPPARLGYKSARDPFAYRARPGSVTSRPANKYAGVGPKGRPA